MNRSLFRPTALATLTALCFLAPSSHAANVEESALRAHLALLSSDLFEGRGTGQRGGDLTMAYLETQAAVLGLQPANGKSFRQPLQLAGIKPLVAESSLQIQAQGQALKFAYGTDWVWNSRAPQTTLSFAQQLVFAGYGTLAPEERWDDFKGTDVRGKILIVLANDPQPTSAEPERFAGKAMTYYARRSYKFEEALKRGAQGVLVIYNEATVPSSWKAVSEHADNEQFMLPNSDTGLPMVGWLTENAARKLFAASGQHYDQLLLKAEQRDFTPVALTAQLQGDLMNKVRTISQDNIAALVPGTDPKLRDEVVIYSAHWDHLGKLEAKPGEAAKDLIFNGAVDNASGSAALLAMAKAAVQQPAKRSQLFLWLAAEEEGLLGSEYYASHPLFPLQKTAANLNLDTLNFVGRTKDIGVSGSERSDLGTLASQVATSMQLTLAPRRVDTQGYYFRSDHFSFAKAGIPAFSVGSGSQYVQNQETNSAKRAAYGQRYHEASDEYDASWDLSGMAQQAQFALNLGRAVADGEQMPKWKAGDVFGKVRGQ
ncbi:MAG: M28 family peptidase [Burkholderiales bacterium]|nr:M28 family peptidase [Burkholderiales bacterium]